MSVSLGQKLMAMFGAENKAMVAKGEITNSDLFTISSELADIQQLLSSGSLEMAKLLWSSKPTMVGLSSKRKEKYDNMLGDFLNRVRERYPLPGEGQ